MLSNSSPFECAESIIRMKWGKLRLSSFSFDFKSCWNAIPYSLEYWAIANESVIISQNCENGYFSITLDAPSSR